MYKRAKFLRIVIVIFIKYIIHRIFKTDLIAKFDQKKANAFRFVHVFKVLHFAAKFESHRAYRKI